MSSLMDRLERKLGKYAIPQLTMLLVAAQTLFFLVLVAQPEMIKQMVYVPELALNGEWWRFLTLLFIPPTSSVIFIFFALYFFYLMGTTLENQWGHFRFNLFILTSYLFTLLAAFIEPSGVATNAYIGSSVFLAFAFLYPEFVIHLFFILPVRIKWLALITWALYFWRFAVGDMQEKALVLAATANFFLFFGYAVYHKVRYGARQMIQQKQRIAEKEEAFHRCTTCGITDKSHPKMEFRYCPDCKGSPGYCMEHIHKHVHKA